MAKVFGGLRDSQADRVAQRQARWMESRFNMARYLSSPEWRAKSKRAFRIWRGIGWTLTGGLLAGRVWSDSLHGSARLMLAWPVQDLAAFGFGYALLVRGTALAQNRRLKRVGHHIGYTHVDTSVEANGIDNTTWPGCRERWYEIWPVTQRVNRMESRLRHDKPSPGFKRYFRRTIVALALVRFWWVWLSVWVAVWAEGALSVHAMWGWALWPTGASNVLTWFEMVGHRI